MRPERAGDGLTERGLADPGRTDQRHHGAGAAAADDLQAAGRATGADGQVLHDPVLDVVQAVVVGVQHGPGGDDVGRVGGLGAPRQVEDGVQPGPQVAGLGALVAAPLELADLAQGGLADVLGQVGLLDPGAVVLRAVGLVLAELLADGVELLAEQELALALLHALADVVGDLVVDLGLGEVVLGPLDQRGQPLGDVGGLQQLPLLLVGQVGRVAGQVGQGGRVGDPVDGVDDLPGVTPLQGGDDQRLVLGGQLADRRRSRWPVSSSSSASTHRAVPGPETPEPILTRRSARITAAGSPVCQPADLDDGGLDAVRGVAVLQAGCDEQVAVAVERAASTAARAASSSSIGTTMPGSTTRSVRKRTGS